eukprot:m.187030 g.187030  ORF g.187030 m.187030 type:complete len:79 (+) comp39357_c1_seq63:532-768(+)
MPSGYEERKAGDSLSANCTFPTLPRNLVLKFNGVEGERDSGNRDSQVEHIGGEVGFGLNLAKTGLASRPTGFQSNYQS